MSTQLQTGLELQAEIGRGHFGRVCSGKDSVRQLVAVKVPQRLPAETLEKWERRKLDLLREGANLERARHRNVVAVHYVCRDECGDEVYLVMEFCAGGSLETEYRRGPISSDRLVSVGRGIGLGLQALHSKGMIHRDIKPGNLLLDDRGVAKLGDFGFVTDEIVEGYAAGAGYLDHLAPEYFSDRVTSARSDIWALGMTFYRLLHGHQWYSAHISPRHVVRDGGYRDKLSWLPHVSKEWRRLIRSMLSDDPHSRPQHAQIMGLLARIGASPWEAELTPNGIVWSKVAKGRRIEVRTERTGPRHFNWEATSHPTHKGRSRRLAGANHLVWRDVDRELRLFFEKS